MQQLRDYFDERAAQWDELITDEVVDRLRDIVRKLALPRGGKVLDVGSGTGVLIPMLIDVVGLSGTVVALDFSPQMLAEAKKKYHWPNLEFLEGDAQNIPLGVHEVDEVVCNSAFPHFADFWQAAKEMGRVLKSGGRVSVFHPHSRDYINDLHVSLGGAVGNDLLPEESTMFTIFSEAGFEDIVIEDTSHYYLLTGRKL